MVRGGRLYVMMMDYHRKIRCKGFKDGDFTDGSCKGNNTKKWRSLGVVEKKRAARLKYKAARRKNRK